MNSPGKLPLMKPPQSQQLDRNKASTIPAWCTMPTRSQQTIRLQIPHTRWAHGKCLPRDRCSASFPKRQPLCQVLWLAGSLHHREHMGCLQGTCQLLPTNAGNSKAAINQGGGKYCTLRRLNEILKDITRDINPLHATRSASISWLWMTAQHRSHGEDCLVLPIESERSQHQCQDRWR